MNILPCLRSGIWKIDEDNRCKKAVYKILEENNCLPLFQLNGELPKGFPWIKVASFVQTRNRKQCRARFINNLNPFLLKSAWTLEEDEFLIEMQSIFPNSWKKISKYLVGRSPNEVKMRWKSKKSCFLAKIKREKEFFESQCLYLKEEIVSKTEPKDTLEDYGDATSLIFRIE